MKSLDAPDMDADDQAKVRVKPDNTEYATSALLHGGQLHACMLEPTYASMLVPSHPCIRNPTYTRLHAQRNTHFHARTNTRAWLLQLN